MSTQIIQPNLEHIHLKYTIVLQYFNEHRMQKYTNLCTLTYVKKNYIMYRACKHGALC